MSIKQARPPDIIVLLITDTSFDVAIYIENLFSDEVKEFNQSRHGQPQVIDPSSELVTVANTFMSWCKFFRRVTPAKSPADIATLQILSDR